MIDHKALIAVLSFGAACAIDTTTTTDVTLPQPNEAGVSTYRVTETADDLMIIGEDAAGNVVGHVEAKKGRYTMSEWFAQDRSADQLDVDGIRLDVEVDGTPWSHEAVGYSALKLQLPDGDRYHRFDAFALDARVTQALAGWGIKLTASRYVPPPSSETAYDFAGDWCVNWYSGQYTTDISTYNICGINQHPANQEFTATLGGYFDLFTDEMCICNESNCPSVAKYHMFFSHKECCGSAYCTTISCGGAGPNGCAVCGAAVDTGYTYNNRSPYTSLGIGQAGADCYVNGLDLGTNPCGSTRDELCHYY